MTILEKKGKTVKSKPLCQYVWNSVYGIAKIGWTANECFASIEASRVQNVPVVVLQLKITKTCKLFGGILNIFRTWAARQSHCPDLRNLPTEMNLNNCVIIKQKYQPFCTIWRSQMPRLWPLHGCLGCRNWSHGLTRPWNSPLPDFWGSPQFGRRRALPGRWSPWISLAYFGIFVDISLIFKLFYFANAAYFILRFLSNIFSRPFCVYLEENDYKDGDELTIWRPCSSDPGKSPHKWSCQIRKCSVCLCWAQEVSRYFHCQNFGHWNHAACKQQDPLIKFFIEKQTLKRSGPPCCDSCWTSSWPQTLFCPQIAHPALLIHSMSFLPL